jgi:hypothetical protein
VSSNVHRRALTGMNSFDTPKLQVRAVPPVCCTVCFVYLNVNVETGIYTHPATECLVSDKRAAWIPGRMGKSQWLRSKAGRYTGVALWTMSH